LNQLIVRPALSRETNFLSFSAFVAIRDSLATEAAAAAAKMATTAAAADHKWCWTPFRYNKSEANIESEVAAALSEMSTLIWCDIHCPPRPPPPSPRLLFLLRRRQPANHSSTTQNTPRQYLLPLHFSVFFTPVKRSPTLHVLHYNFLSLLLLSNAVAAAGTGKSRSTRLVSLPPGFPAPTIKWVSPFYPSLPNWTTFTKRCEKQSERVAAREQSVKSANSHKTARRNGMNQ
jgi:hypothetical protein